MNTKTLLILVSIFTLASCGDPTRSRNLINREGEKSSLTEAEDKKAATCTEKKARALALEVQKQSIATITEVLKEEVESSFATEYKATAVIKDDVVQSKVANFHFFNQWNKYKQVVHVEVNMLNCEMTYSEASEAVQIDQDGKRVP